MMPLLLGLTQQSLFFGAPHNIFNYLVIWTVSLLFFQLPVTDQSAQQKWHLET